MADRRPDYGVFALILLLAALSTALASLVQSPLLEAIQRNVNDIRLGTLLGTTSLFGIPGILLDMVSPFAVRLQMESVGTSGKTVGRIYAISTFGTLIRQFYLILRYILRSTRKLGITPTNLVIYLVPYLARLQSL